MDFVENLPESSIAEVNLGTITPADLTWKKLIPMTFVESPLADELLWPFEEAAEPSVSAEFTTTSGGYKIVVDNFKGNVSDGMKGFVFGAAEGDCIVFPAMEGLALNGVTLTLGASGNAGNPAVVNESGIVVGQARTGSKKAGDTIGWTFTGEHKMVNKLALTSAPDGDGCAIRSLVLSYRTAAETEYFVRSITTASASDIDAKAGKATLNASYTCSLDDPSKYEAGFEYRIKGTDAWTKVYVQNPAQSGFSYDLSDIETEHFYEFRAFAKGETDIDTVYGEILEFEISEVITLNLVFGDGTGSTSLYNTWAALWGLAKGNSGVKGPLDKTYTAGGVDYTFTLCADHNVSYRTASSKYWGYCFDYSTVTTEPHYNGWILLPGVEGMALSRVEVKINQKCSISLSKTVDANNYGDKAYASATQTATTAVNTLIPEGVGAGERVYLCSEGRNATVMYLIIKYVPVK